MKSRQLPANDTDKVFSGKERNMSVAMRVILALACLSVLLGAASCQHNMPVERQYSNGIEKAILKVHSAMKKAAENLDTDTLYSYVLDTNKGSIIENGRLFLTRKDSLESTKQGLGRLKGLSYSYTQRHITVLSPVAALWVGQGTATATLEDGREFSSPFAESIVFVKKGGKWKVLHAHRSSPFQR
jgi:ketosteroid isomerase-like protein